MPTILHKENWFDSSQGVTKTYVREGTTPSEYVEQFHDGEFLYPTVLEINGREIMRGDWDRVSLSEEDSVVFRRLAQGPVAFLIFQIAAVAYSLYLAFTVDEPDFKDREEPDSVFNLSGQGNRVKLGQPIPVQYGRTVNFPPYAAREYTRFVDNDQILYQIFIAGQGTYDFEKFRFADTETSSFQDVTVEVYEPGDPVTLFPDNIVTSSEVSSIELFATNEDEYAGESGPFVANDAGTQATVLEWDVVLPRGLYYQDDEGELVSHTVTANFSYRPIDDSGSPLGPYVTVPFTKALATNTPQRFTVIVPVSAGRYEVKAVRSGLAEGTSRYAEVVQWYQLRAELPSTKDYGNVTTIAVRSRATNNLNNKTRQRFNTIGTRKLEQWNGSSWTAAAATRNPAWAFADILRSSYGGQLDNDKIALDALLTLAGKFSAGGWNFDWIFDKTTTIYDAMKTVATACRSAAVVRGNAFTMAFDEPIAAPTSAFGPENMIEGSYNSSIGRLPNNANDGILVSYIDKDTWKEETVKCLYGSDAGSNLRSLTIPGVVDRNKAFQLGMYTRAKEVLQREVVGFETGKEGRVPVYGDLVAVSHDIDFRQSGLVDSIGVDDRTISLSQPLTSFAGNLVALRDASGGVAGPYECLVDVSDPYTITTTSDISGNFSFASEDEPPMWFFGTESGIYQKCLLTEKKSSSDGETETLSLVEYAEGIYQFDDYEAPPLANANVPESPDPIPAVTGLALNQDAFDLNKVLITWNAVASAQYYLVQISYDNISWSQASTTNANFFAATVQTGTLWARVAAINDGQGPFATQSAIFGVHVRITDDGHTRVTSDGDIRVST